MRYDDEPDDPNDPLPEDLDDGEDDDPADGEPCSNCGNEIYAGQALCPHCGEWVTGESAAAGRSRGWLWPGVVALLIAIILVMWHGLGR